MNISKHLSSTKNTLLSMLILPLLFIGESSAEIYKWVDADGTVHYTQQRPSDTNAERLDIQQEPTTTFRNGTKDAVKSEESVQAGENKPAEDPTAQEEKKPETTAEKKQRLEACARARKSLTRMESIGRIRSKDAEGNYSYLSQQQKEAQMKQARDLIKKYCY